MRPGSGRSDGCRRAGHRAPSRTDGPQPTAYARGRGDAPHGDGRQREPSHEPVRVARARRGRDPDVADAQLLGELHPGLDQRGPHAVAPEPVQDAGRDDLHHRLTVDRRRGRRDQQHGAGDLAVQLGDEQPLGRVPLGPVDGPEAVGDVVGLRAATQDVGPQAGQHGGVAGQCRAQGDGEPRHADPSRSRGSPMCPFPRTPIRLNPTRCGAPSNTRIRHRRVAKLLPRPGCVRLPTTLTAL